MYRERTTRKTLWKMTRERIQKGSFAPASLGLLRSTAKPPPTTAK